MPASEPAEAQLARIAALRADLAASGVELEAELERAGASRRARSGGSRLSRRLPGCRRRPAAAAPPARRRVGRGAGLCCAAVTNEVVSVWLQELVHRRSSSPGCLE